MKKLRNNDNSTTDIILEKKNGTEFNSDRMSSDKSKKDLMNCKIQKFQ
jgi:hypothetical protein